MLEHWLIYPVLSKNLLKKKCILIFFDSDLMLTQINDIVASMMVLPNRQVFPLVSDLQIGYLRWSNPQVNFN